MYADRSPAESKHAAADHDTRPEADLATCSYLTPTAGRSNELLCAEPVPGDLLGGAYHILRRIAVGGMGIVYQAWRRPRGQLSAIKLVPARARGEAALRLALHAETTALRRIRHANVIRALDHGELADGAPYLVLEWMDGGSVTDVLRSRGALPPRRATRLAIAACRALQAVHRAGLLHLDVKPANLLLNDRGRLKLADFGLCVEVDQRGQAPLAAGLGTPAYFAPEQAAGLPMDPRTDLYSLGVTYFELLTGRRPFAGRTLLQCARDHVEAHVPCPRTVRPDVPEVCAAIARRAMAKEQGDRFADAGRMLVALQETLAHLRESRS
jgi:serine/threonine-protein kinase